MVRHAPLSLLKRNARRSRSLLLAASIAALSVCTLIGAGDAEAIGLLIPNDRSLEPLAIQKHRVDVHMTDGAAVTRVEQVFVNRTNRQLEATFYFPVPPGSTVSDFSLWINGKKTKGAVLEKNKARQIYESIVRRTQDPGLIEYMDGTLFQARIFPVPANGTQKVEIAFASVMDQTGAMRRFLYPLKTGRTAARLIEDFAFTAHIDSKAPLKAIYSPSHAVQVKRDSDHKATVSFTKNAVDLERDFLLYVGASQEDVGLSLLTYDPDGKGGEDGYFLMLLNPRVDVEEAKLASKMVTFVVDTSGSMSGEKMDQARSALKQCLGTLREGDRFNIVRFSTDVEGLFNAPREATKDNIKQGMAFAQRLEAYGGTAIDEALGVALRSKPAQGQPHFVIFMTDGRPTVGTTDVQAILRHAQANNGNNARIFTFGVGYKVNTTLLDQLADRHAGDSDYVRPEEDIEVKVSALADKIAYPVMTDLQVNYNTQGVYDTYPRRLPDLFRGGQVVVMGRYRNALPSTINLEGFVDGQGVGMRFDEVEDIASAGTAQVAHDFIPKLWATRKVGYLLDAIRAQGAVAELRDEVIRLGKRYGLVTPYTSYLAVDDSEFEQQRPPVVRRPPPMPAPRADAPRVLEEAAGTDSILSGLGGGGKGKGGMSRPSRSGLRAEAMQRYKDKKKRAKAEARLRSTKSLDADSGEEAVETSIATKLLKKANHSGDTASSAGRYLAGKLFVRSGGAWRQDGLTAKPSVTIQYLSPAWFNLIKAHPALKPVLGLGSSVVLKVGSKTIQIAPKGKTDLSIDTIKKW